MCLRCHLGLSDKNIHTQMKNIKVDQLEKCNTCAISHFIIAASGYNGEEVRNVSIEVLENYRYWLKNNPECVLDDSLSLNNLDTKIKNIKKKSINLHSIPELCTYLSEL